MGPLPDPRLVPGGRRDGVRHGGLLPETDCRPDRGAGAVRVEPPPADEHGWLVTSRQSPCEVSEDGTSIYIVAVHAGMEAWIYFIEDIRNLDDEGFDAFLTAMQPLEKVMLVKRPTHSQYYNYTRTDIVQEPPYLVYEYNTTLQNVSSGGPNGNWSMQNVTRRSNYTLNPLNVTLVETPSQHEETVNSITI